MTLSVYPRCGESLYEVGFDAYLSMQAAEEGSLGPGALLGIAVPLLQQVIVEGAQMTSTSKSYVPKRQAESELL